MHHHAYKFVRDVAASLGTVTSILEIGSRNINGTIRPLFHPTTYLGVDLVAGPDVDLVADGATVDPGYPVDCVICCEVLEHTPDAEAIVTHALDLLSVGGHLIVTAAAPYRAAHSAVDGGPLRPGEHYANITSEQLVSWVTARGGHVQALRHALAQGDVYLWATKEAR